ncbi:MAG: acyl-CoA dehydrogenase family protein [candidate division KSB1 bacterium]|nr:acyl-CoA dehydrogenase family protein [candidate division KSB1 bacterium]MDZ7274314.1 acyl-CoA dehydrogenase family protein [candidate division KSB1 bacterium]MDZ7287164.1 acyl-CoA dehydrogenase family protein [candidate division KSB1 bacterium]MDZ7296911.1 acyl-CoA dehydrogenase family protein [candidate division KSB1 bacterium]MDZ7307864.1 acyl-CoA dehydrogenase family protein [candidate division KSB1 bacterium]
MTLEALHSPLAFLQHMLGAVPAPEQLRAQEQWWQAEGNTVSRAIDQGGTPWLRMFDAHGTRVDEILLPPAYWSMLKRGYCQGIIWRVFEEHSLLPFCHMGYVTAFHDPGLFCPYTVSLATAVALEKYGSDDLKNRFLTPLLRRDESVWQGATWMTEIKGGSDLGAAVETTAVRAGDCWRLTGAKYFASNVGAELALVAARPAGARPDVRGLALFLVPKLRDDGSRNYFVRRLKDKIATRAVPTGEVELHDSEAHLLGTPEQGIYLILEVLNLSRVANSLASVALMQRALGDARDFAASRRAFGKPVLQQPLLRRQFDERLAQLRAAFALAWEAAQLLEAVWQERPPYSERHHLFRLLAHLAKYWTAEVAVQTAKWAMEVYGGAGTLAEFGIERWLREAMILQIWEGTPHRQILDGLEVMERKQAHRLLEQHLAAQGGAETLAALRARIETLPGLSRAEKEAGAEALFRELAMTTAKVLSQKEP